MTCSLWVLFYDPIARVLPHCAGAWAFFSLFVDGTGIATNSLADTAGTPSPEQVSEEDMGTERQEDEPGLGDE